MPPEEEPGYYWIDRGVYSAQWYHCLVGHVPSCALIRHHAPSCATMRHRAHHVPPCATMRHRATMRHHAPPRATMHHHAPLCATIHHHLPPCTTGSHILGQIPADKAIKCQTPWWRASSSFVTWESDGIGLAFPLLTATGWGVAQAKRMWLSFRGMRKRGVWVKGLE
jgi:hypothetical protein